MLKRIFAALLAAVLILAFGGCAATKPESTAPRLRIVCTAFPQYDFLRALTAGAQGVKLSMLLKPGQESHDYDPSSQDILAIHGADMFVYGGGESDSWIEGVLSTVDTADKTVAAMMDMVQPLVEELHDGETHEGHNHEYDEHVWTSPKNARVIAARLCDLLCERDAAQAELYRANGAAYAEKLTALDDAFTALVAGAARRTIVVADRFPILYFCKAYGLSYHAAFSGCAASVEPSSQSVQALIDAVKSEQIAVIFKMELSAGQVAQTVADNTGCRVETFYACHNVSADDFAAGVTYLSLMQENYTVLKEALS